MNVGPCTGDCDRIMDRGPHGRCKHCAQVTDGGTIQMPAADHPDVSKARETLKRLAAEGQSFIKARDLAEPCGLTTGETRMVLRRLEADGVIERWTSSGHKAHTYEIELGGNDE